MTLSHWWQILTLYEVILVWPLALATLLVASRSKSRRRQLFGVGVIVLLFTPYIHRWIGDLYFDYLCKHEAGEFIYRTVDNVEGILQMRPRDGSKDYFDRMAAGDIPEDPWGHTNWEAQRPATLFVDPPWRPYRFFESYLPTVESFAPVQRDIALLVREEVNARVRHYYGHDQKRNLPMRVDHLIAPKSKYGYTWGRERTSLHKLFNVYPGELRVVYLETGEVMATFRGFYKTRWVGQCPHGKDGDLVYRLVSRVARPPSQ